MNEVKGRIIGNGKGKWIKERRNEEEKLLWISEGAKTKTQVPRSILKFLDFVFIGIKI